MEQTLFYDRDLSQWGYAQLSLLCAEILGKFISVIVQYPGSEVQFVYSFSPGLASTVATLEPFYMHGVIFVKFLMLTNISYLILFSFKDEFSLDPDMIPKTICGHTNYRIIFENRDRPDPLVLKSNGGDLFSPILLVRFNSYFQFNLHVKGEQHAQYHSGSVACLLVDQIRVAIVRANKFHPELTPINFPERIMINLDMTTLVNMCTESSLFQESNQS